MAWTFRRESKRDYSTELEAGISTKMEFAPRWLNKRIELTLLFVSPALNRAFFLLLGGVLIETYFI